METVFIYALCEPGTRTVRYIGMTGNPKRRFRSHTCKTKCKSNHRECWLSSLISKGLKPEMIILREVPKADWKRAEERYIRLARGCAMKLTNGSDGGDGRLENSPETIKKMRECKLGPKNYWFGTGPMLGKPSPFKGVPRTAEVVHNIKEAIPRGAKHHAFGKVFSDEEKLVLSLGGKRGKKRVGASSPFLGVCWQKFGVSGKWAAALCAGGKNIHLGLFTNEQDAARAYDTAAIAQFGSGISLNFPIQ